MSSFFPSSRHGNRCHAPNAPDSSSWAHFWAPIFCFCSFDSMKVGRFFPFSFPNDSNSIVIKSFGLFFFFATRLKSSTSIHFAYSCSSGNSSYHYYVVKSENRTIRSYFFVAFHFQPNACLWCRLIKTPPAITLSIRQKKNKNPIRRLSLTHQAIEWCLKCTRFVSLISFSSDWNWRGWEHKKWSFGQRKETSDIKMCNNIQMGCELAGTIKLVTVECRNPLEWFEWFLCQSKSLHIYYVLSSASSSSIIPFVSQSDVIKMLKWFIVPRSHAVQFLRLNAFQNSFLWMRWNE